MRDLNATYRQSVNKDRRMVHNLQFRYLKFIILAIIIELNKLKKVKKKKKSQLYFRKAQNVQEPGVKKYKDDFVNLKLFVSIVCCKQLKP